MRSESRRKVVAVVGDAVVSAGSAKDVLAEEIGRALVDAGFRVMTGGLGGVMESACRGARSSDRYAPGDTIGVLPGHDPTEANPHVDIVIPSDRWTQVHRRLPAPQWDRRVGRRGSDRWTHGRIGMQAGDLHAASADAALIDGHIPFDPQERTPPGPLPLPFPAPTRAASADAALIDGHSDESKTVGSLRAGKAFLEGRPRE